MVPHQAKFFWDTEIWLTYILCAGAAALPHAPALYVAVFSVIDSNGQV
jgi:hypothetical protein